MPGSMHIVAKKIHIKYRRIILKHSWAAKILFQQWKKEQNCEKSQCCMQISIAIFILSSAECPHRIIFAIFTQIITVSSIV